MRVRIKYKNLAIGLLILLTTFLLVLYFAQNHFDVLRRETEHGRLMNITNEDIFRKYNINLLPEDVPSTLVYIWCSNASFSFKHFLSIKSAIRYLKPSVVAFIYWHYPVINQTSYHSWLSELADEFPFWVEMKTELKAACAEEYILNEDLLYILKHHKLFSHKLSTVLYVSPTTIFIREIKAKSNVSMSESKSGYRLVSEDKILSAVNCPKRHVVDHIQLSHSCITLTKDIYPEDIIYNDKSTAAALRKIFYDDERKPLPRYDSTTKAPNIAHYIWLGGGQMNLGFYLSVLSALFVGKIEKVYIHGDRPPRGAFWEKVMVKFPSNVIFVPQYRPPGIFKQEISVVGHLADSLKSHVMYTYGGIMLDPDIIINKPIDEEYFYYETVISYDIANNAPFPVMFNMGISVSKPKGRFAKAWINSERKFVDNDWLWNCGSVTYKLWERDPTLAFVATNLQMLCYRYKCHPLWIPRHIFQDLDEKHDAMRYAPDWKERAISVHFTFPDYFFTLNNTVYVQKGVVGELGRKVLRSAGIIGQNEGLVP